MIAAHRDRHPLADEHVVAIIDDRRFADAADSENKSLWRINDRTEGVDAEAAEIRNGEIAALKFLRLHPLVACAMRKVFDRFADFAQRLLLRFSHNRRDEPVLERDCDTNVD